MFESIAHVDMEWLYNPKEAKVDPLTLLQDAKHPGSKLGWCFIQIFSFCIQQRIEPRPFQNHIT